MASSSLLSAGSKPGTEMTKETLRKICREQDLYSTAYLNDKIYLHYKGFRRISCLEEYTGLRVLYMEGNSISKIEGLSMQKELRALYLQENLIEVIEGLDDLVELDTLNLNQNFVESVSGLEKNARLGTLLLQNNRIKEATTLDSLVKNPRLSVLDLSNNRLEDHEAVLTSLSKLPDLRVLYLKGNPLVETTPSYRKTVLSRLPHLRYLDDRPVFEDERRTVTAWAEGGVDSEKKERELIRQEAVDKAMRQHEEFSKMLEQIKDANDTELANFNANGGKAPEDSDGEEEEKEAKAVTVSTHSKGIEIVEEAEDLPSLETPANPQQSQNVATPSEQPEAAEAARSVTADEDNDEGGSRMQISDEPERPDGDTLLEVD